MIAAFYHPDQSLHAPRQFMRAGVLADPTDLPARTEALLGALAKAGITPQRPADPGSGALRAVHDPGYLSFLETAYERWRAVPDAGPEVLPNNAPYWAGAADRAGRPPCRAPGVVAQACYYLGDLAVPIGPQTWTSARVSAHSAVAAADHAAGGGGLAYALCRPSGHHARADRANGFCYLNNAAIAAERLRGRFDRVAVLDVDAHHGDGTQEIFYHRGDVLTVSVHVDPAQYYPYFTGYADEIGHGAGQGANLNLPLAPGAGDDAMMAALDQAEAALARFDPQALVVSLGFDALAVDPLGMMTMTPAGFGRIAQRVAGLGRPVVVVQEGGYAIDAIGACLSAFLTGLRRG